MPTQLFSTSSHGRLLNGAAGVTKPLKIATFGTSLMTSANGFGVALQYALHRYHNANVIYNHRSVLTSVADDTVVADPGQSYATGSATSSHMVNKQLVQFNTDVAAGKTADIMFTDGGFFNDNPANQTDLDTAFSRTMTLIDAFLDPAGNDGIAVAVVGTNGNKPEMCVQWANMWREQERVSGGRIRFIDTAPELADLTNTNPTTWAFRSSGSFQNSMTVDGTHPSYFGSRSYSHLIADFLRDVCPAKFPYRGNSLATSAYAPSTAKYGNLLGLNGNMQGTGGMLDYALNTNVPGTSGAGTVDRWAISHGGGGSGLSPAIGTGPEGQKQLEIGISGLTGTDYFEVFMGPTITNVNNSVSTRKYMLGATIELVGVTGLCLIESRQKGVSGYWDLPISPSSNASGRLPDLTSETWEFRTMFPVPYSGNNPFGLWWLFYINGTPAGTIKIRDPWWFLVEE